MMPLSGDCFHCWPISYRTRNPPWDKCLQSSSSRWQLSFSRFRSPFSTFFASLASSHTRCALLRDCMPVYVSCVCANFVRSFVHLECDRRRDRVQWAPQHVYPIHIRTHHRQEYWGQPGGHRGTAQNCWADQEAAHWAAFVVCHCQSCARWACGGI